jgi:hypothetical protein
MHLTNKITFVAAVNNRAILKENLAASSCFSLPASHEVLLREGFSSAAAAYNNAIDEATNDLIVFCHQDIFLPETWLPDLSRALDWLEVNDPNWGVLGCYGETLNDHGRGYIYSSGRGVLGTPSAPPEPVQTLDEIVLILRKSSGLRFDERLPHFHLYGADICLRAARRGLKNYAISAFCVHNTNQTLVLPAEFYECYKHIKRTWREQLPVQTTCIRITANTMPLYGRRLHELYLRFIRRKQIGGKRIANVKHILQTCPVETTLTYDSFASTPAD